MVKFGTGGWRAIIGDEFTKANIRHLSAALAQKMIHENIAGKGFIIGYDRRFLSHESAKWIAEVMAYYEIPCYLITREAPTPLVMYTVKYYNANYGVVVTASHNPAIYNGVKIFTQGGRDADEATTKSIEEWLLKTDPTTIGSYTYEEGLAAGRITEINPQNEYIDSIIRTLNMDAIRSKRLSVALDPMFGVSRTCLSTILMTARCEVDVIHERRDALFGGRLPAPNENTLRALTAFVLENHCDIGIATDGDADRVGIIDNKGQFLHPNKILTLLYYYLLKYKGWKGPCVRNIATTHLLDKVAQGFGETCYEVPVGFKHISAKMLETNAIIGGESSGGLTVRGHIQGKDGIYASALLVEMIAITGRSLADIYEDITTEYGGFYMEERDFSFTQQKKDAITDILLTQQKLPSFPWEVDHISYLDGCKTYFKNGGWVVARFSGTEPLLRIFCEMPTQDEALCACTLMESFLGLAAK